MYRSVVKFYLVFWIIGAFFNLNTVIALTNKIPIEILGKDPEIAKIEISPNGANIAYTKSINKRYNIFIKNLETNHIKQITFSKTHIDDFFWSNNNTIIYSQQNAGNEVFHLYATSLVDDKILDLTPYSDVTCSIVDKLENFDGKILIQMNKRNRSVFDIYKLDTSSGETTLVAENPGDVTKWIVDHEGKLRALEFTDGVNTGIRYRNSEKDDWNTIAIYNFKEKATPLCFTFDNKNLYVSSNIGRDKQAIYEYDLVTGKVIKCIYENPYVDIFEHPDIHNDLVFPKPLIISNFRKKLLGIKYIIDKIEYKFFDKTREKIQKFIDEQLPDYENQIVSQDHNEKKFIILSNNDRTYGSYYLFDIENWNLSKLFDISPWINEEKMSSTKPFYYNSRDGLIIHAYLTLPKEKNKNIPLVVIPHGGPWDRDFIKFNPEIQFFVNRGFAVLQMNFRGSIGYGQKFFEAGFKQWGLKMQDDITDGVQWIINQGIANPNKIVIYGASYGGYAALMGAIKTPNLYIVAIDFVGISNLFALFDEIPPEREMDRQMLYEMIGNPKKDKKQFFATSPVFNVDRINIPLFIAQGANDPRVKKEQSDQMVEALKKRGIQVEYMVKQNEGHGFDNEENIFDFYHSMDAFLEKYVYNENKQ